MLEEIGLTDDYFKELLKTRKDYLVLLINSICNLNLKEEDIIFGDTEERDGTTLKTIKYDIKVVSKNLNLDIEAQRGINDKTLNNYGEYSYDINRAVYYLSLLHSRSYERHEKGYKDKKSIVIFIYLYDIPGRDVIQKTNLHNTSTNVEYDNIILYSVSLAKIEENSKIEVERALKLLSEKDLTSYRNDESKVIREAVDMLEGYDKSEIAAMIRDAKRKEEFERGYLLESAEERGKEAGAKQKLEENIKTMFNNGFDDKTISKALSLDINYVKEVLSK